MSSGRAGDHMRWFWSLYGVVGKPPKVQCTRNGHAATLEEVPESPDAVHSGRVGRVAVTVRTSRAETERATSEGPGPLNHPNQSWSSPDCSV